MVSQFDLLSLLLVPVGAFVVGALLIHYIELKKNSVVLSTQQQDGQ